jgi:precorrin-3B synthase
MLAAMPSTPAATRADRPGAGRSRDDACPGTLRLHEADDGFLARIRLPGGLLTAEQALALADAAQSLGDGGLELTSRGNVQLRGLAADAGGPLAAMLRGTGLLPSDRHERARNILASPLSGLDAAGQGDVRPWVRELDRLLCTSEQLAGLSGRFLFALDDGRGDVAARDADVTVLACQSQAALVRLGGSAAALRVAAAQAAYGAVLAAEEFLTLVRDQGARAWRIREADPEAVLLLPRLRSRLDREGIAWVPAEAPATPPGTPPVPGPVRQADGRTALSVGTRFGRVSADQWRLLAQAAADGADELRVTPWRGVVIPGLPPDRLPALAAAGLLTEAGTAWERATACTGRPGCAKSLADVRSEAAAALQDSPVTPGGPELLPVHWSGCERRCGHPSGRWVDVLATATGYRVSAQGTELFIEAEVTTEQMAAATAAARRTT